MLAYRWGPIEKPAELALREPRLLSFRPDGAANSRRVAFGDVNCDGRSDLIVTYGDLAEADVSLKGDDGKMLASAQSPILSDVQGVVVGNFDSQKGDEVVFASVAEKVIGRSRWLESGRLSIPENNTLPGEGDAVAEPLLVAWYPLPADLAFEGKTAPHDAFAALLRVKSGQYQLQILSYQDDGAVRSHGVVDIAASSQPKGLRTLDLDGNGLQDVIVFVPYDNPKVYLVEKPTAEAGESKTGIQFKEASSDRNFGISQLAKLEPKAVTVGKFPTSPEEASTAATSADDLLIASKSHGRALRLDDNGRLKIVEQFSGRGTSANIQGVLAINLDADPDPEVLTYDLAANAIDLLDRGDSGIYRRVRTIDMLGFTFDGFHATDVDGDRRLDVVVQGVEGIAGFLRGKDEYGFVQCAEFDPGDEEHGRAEDFGKPYLLSSGDLNGDGRLDLCYVTQPRYYFTVLQPKDPSDPKGMLGADLLPRFRFQIFEEKSYMRSNQGHGPRQITVADVTGDARDDLIMLIHDRVLLYVQE